MGSERDIDRQREVHIYGTVALDVSGLPLHPAHDVAMGLYKALSDPACLRLCDPVDGVSIELPAADFMAWLDTRASWATVLFSDLQCISQTTAGEPLLTTWLRADLFWAMLAAGKDTPSIGAIHERTRGWQSLRLDDICFDFFAADRRPRSPAQVTRGRIGKDVLL